MRLPIPVALALVPVLGLGAAVGAQVAAPLPAPAAGSGLARLLAAQASRIPAHAGVYVKHLRTGEEAAVHGDERFNSYSVIKLAVLVMAYQMADRGAIDLNQRIEIRAEDYRGGTGIFRQHDVGQRPTVRDVLTEMVITSDNTATDLMIARVGGVAAVNQWLAQAGYRDVELRSTTGEFFRHYLELVDPKYRSLTPLEVFALRTAAPPTYPKLPQALIDEFRKASEGRDLGGEFLKRAQADRSFWLGEMSPRGIGRMLEAIETGTAASKASCAEMIRILRAQQAGARRLPHFLDVPVGHKTGDGPPSVANDVGIIYARSGPIVIAVFTEWNTGSYGETEDMIGRLAQTVTDYFDGPREPLR